MLNTFDKSFFAYIPVYMRVKLEAKLILYHDAPWFRKAWDEFAKIASTSSMRDIPDPDEFFEKFENESVLAIEPEEQAVKFSEDDLGETLYGSLDIHPQEEEPEGSTFLDGE